MADKKFYYDVVAQIFEDEDGIHYSVGQGFCEGKDEPLIAHGTVDSVEEAIYIIRREIDGLLNA